MTTCDPQAGIGVAHSRPSDLLCCRVGAVILILSVPTSRIVAQETIAPAVPYEAVARSLEAWLEVERAAKGVPALSIALVDDQRLVWARGFGSAEPATRRPATAETVYRVGSVSKLFTDLALMQLVERGELRLDDPVTVVLSEFAPRNPFGAPITLRQLAAHRSGLVREPPAGHYFDPTGPSLADTVRSLNATELVYAPGQRAKYSNAGVTLIGAVVERRRGESFAKSVERTVLAPLGLKRTSFAPGPELAKDQAHGQMWSYDHQPISTPTFAMGIGPAGNLVSTVNDLGRFLSALFAGGRGPGGAIVTPETLRMMFSPQFPEPGGKPARFGIGFALGELDGHKRVGHGGAVYGFATEVAALPDEKLGLAVIVAKDCANGLANRVAEAALRLMLAAKRGQRLPAIETTQPVPGDLARRLEGRYARADKGVELAARGGKLFMTRSTGGPRFELRRSGDTLVVDDVFGFGTRVRPQGDAQLVVGDETFDRVEPRTPAPAPARWEGLIGEYGWDHDVLYILEHGGRLHALIEWFFDDPLEELGPDRFRFPDTGLYEREPLVFRRDTSGRAIEVSVGGVVFPRRTIDGEGGVTFRIKPERALPDLRREALAAQPPRETGQFRAPDLVELTTLEPTLRLDVRYATSNNFLGAPVYEIARAFLQRPAAEALVRAHRSLERRGYGLLIHDAYRPWFVTKMFWDATPAPSRIFVADPAKGSKHNRGSAVDLTLYDRATGRPVAMVGGYDEFSARSYPEYPGGTELQRWHRDLLRRAMEDQGFTVNDVEWWHFDAKDWELYPILNVSFEALASRRK